MADKPPSYNPNYPASYPEQAPMMYPQQAPPMMYPQQAPMMYPQQAPVMYPQQVPPPPPGSQYPPGYYSPAVAGQPNVMFAAAACPTQLPPQTDAAPAGEAATNFGSSFSDKSIRRAFVRKVYLILLCQILVTFGTVAIFVFVDDVRNFVRFNPVVYYASYAIFLVVYIALVCCPSVRRRYPTNIICLTIFTFALSYMTGTIASFYSGQAVLIAAGMCAGVCLAISLLSMWSKFDITGCGTFLWICCLILMFFGFAAIFTYNRIMMTIYGALAALILMVLLAYHTQLILGGRRHELSSEEYIVAALVLYLDIVYIFIILLGLTGRK